MMCTSLAFNFAIDLCNVPQNLMNLEAIHSTNEAIAEQTGWVQLSYCTIWKLDSTNWNIESCQNSTQTIESQKELQISKFIDLDKKN